MSDTYYQNKVNDIDCNNLKRNIVPVILILAEREDGESYHIMIHRPFERKNIYDLFNLIEHKQDIIINYDKNNQPIIDLKDYKNIPASINNTRKLPIENDYINQTYFDDTFC